MGWRGPEDPGDGWHALTLEGMEREQERLEAREARAMEACPATGRVVRAVQPEGGYLPPRLFHARGMGDGSPLRGGWRHLPPDVAGLTVDYMTRVAAGADVRDAFRIPLMGARLVGRAGEGERLAEAVGAGPGLGNGAFRAAVLLCGFDVAGRRGRSAWTPDRVGEPSRDALWDLRRMVARMLRFLADRGPLVEEGYTFPGAWTGLVTAGSGDLMTADGLWDMKVSRYPPSQAQTLQMLVYWRLGVHSVDPRYREDVRLIGLVNPLLDMTWELPVADVPADVCERVDQDVIGYPAGEDV